MKTLKSTLTVFAIATSIVTLSCTSNAKTSVYGNIGSEGAQLYDDASGKQYIGKQLAYGDIVEYDANEKTPFVKVRNIATGVEGYVDTLKINVANYPLETPEVMPEEQSEGLLLNIEIDDNGETTAGWVFWKNGDGVKALNSVTMAYNNGRMFTQENYYIGEIHPGYILLTEQIEYGAEKGEKLETPIVVYEDISGRAGVFVNGQCFTPGGQLGGFDTDSWE